MTYPRNDYFESQTDEWKLAYYQTRLEMADRTNAQLYQNWVTALEKIKQLEKNAK